MKKFLVILLVVILLGAVAYFILNSYIENSLEPVNPNENAEIVIEIPSGSSTSAIAEILYKNDLIKNTTTFKYIAKKDGYDVLLKAGKFTLSKSMGAIDILNTLVNKAHSDNTVNLTVIEGLTIENAAKSISKQLSLDENKLIDLMKDAEKFRENHQFLIENADITNLQGYLLPETYNLYVGLSEEEVIDFLLSQFDKFYETSIKPALNDSDLDFEEIINLASIVEKEAMVREERPIIAGVFLSRLEIGMKLQSCATVNYAQGEWKDRLSEKDILIDSPYNTYVVNGLPPTPINSPGKASIEAVLHPEKTEYLYFLAKGDGSHYFSVTYDEHLKAKKKYLD